MNSTLSPTYECIYINLLPPVLPLQSQVKSCPSSLGMTPLFALDYILFYFI